MTSFSSSAFAKRHNGPLPAETRQMLETVGASSLEELIEQIIPADIRLQRELSLPEPLTEGEYLKHLRSLAGKNQVFKSHIGQGYYETQMPAVIQRNILENPGWYTQYTPYQAEIAQGRLEALMVYQTMLIDLTGLPLANASLLDEGTAAAEAMLMFYHLKNKRVKGEPIRRFFVDEGVFPQTVEVLSMRAEPQGIEIVKGKWQEFEPDASFFGALLQYPNARGSVEAYGAFAQKVKEAGAYVAVATDLMALTLLEAPGHWGADVAVGSTQRFGLPMFFGGPHAGFFTCKEAFKRQMPGRIIGLTVDAQGKQAYRMALQTREQHIRREKATSNICTAQALLAILSGMYAVWHGPEGLRQMGERIHSMAVRLSEGLKTLGVEQENEHFFDTLSIPMSDEQQQTVRRFAEAEKINLFYAKGRICVSMNETDSEEDVKKLLNIFAQAVNATETNPPETEKKAIPEALRRQSEYLTHPVFNEYRSETEMMRYLKRLEQRDLSLMQSMIPLGSCTMKLNAAVELLPITWPEWANIHPFAPEEQTQGYPLLLEQVKRVRLTTAPGFSGLAIRAYRGLVSSQVMVRMDAD
ncbi:MAG TPA: aminomethyl-transferring glycine dehydrogenase subunit GcvPA, partial [Phaeodactylibacter sp.]|nr:aminomethyl-transferring glycine dehydrogenase subunit GcvPA [Phaeodactylibacter sp.]